jgi:DNA-binding PucR family transcriptional regulator
VHADDHLLELLVGRAPRTAERLRERVLGALADPQHDELLRTLRALVAYRFDRGATSTALQIHRNTLTYRLGRIQAITGLDLDDPRDVVQVYLAAQSVA